MYYVTVITWGLSLNTLNMAVYWIRIQSGNIEKGCHGNVKLEYTTLKQKTFHRIRF